MSRPGLAVARAADIMKRQEEEEWLIEPLFGKSAVGILGGAPKSCKSWLGLEMAVAISSGTDCLSRFPVRESGPTLVFLAEDSLPEVRERIEALCRHRRIPIEGLDLNVITEPVVRLDDEETRDRLMATVESYRPALLLLDPLVRLHRLDENSAAEVSGLLSHLRALQRTFEVSILLVHHASKRRRSQPGLCLRGSSDLHAWTDSTAILSRQEDDLELVLEHRFAASPEKMRLRLVTDDPPHLVLLGDAPETGMPRGLAEAVVKVVARSDAPLRRGDIRAEVRVNNQRLGETLVALEEAGRIVRTKQGWTHATNGHGPGGGDLFTKETG